MLKKTTFIVLLMMTAMAQAAMAVTFATQRLERLAGYVSLQQLDTLPTGTTYTYSYRQHALTIRKNQWGEIEHIGLLLFGQSLRHANPSPVYDFLERYLLARMVTPATSEDGTKMQWDDVRFTKGSPQSALTLDTLTQFDEERVNLRVYRVGWTDATGAPLLTVSFNMSYQLLTGCDAVELEHNFIRSLSRYQTRDSQSLPAVIYGRLTTYPRQSDLPDEGTEYVHAGSYFISPMVRNDIYFTRPSTKKPWTLVNDKGRATKTIANWMLSPVADNALPMDLVIDKYGYLLDSLQTTYRAWQQLCMDEGCEPFYGLKSKKGGVYRGTVFMVNRRGGYLHLLSINIPPPGTGGGAKATARLYAYIPVHNVSKNVLRDFEPIQ